jgi:FMN-dependent NADH-azoreductase
MKRLLHINASPRRDRSRSGMISDRLLTGLQAGMPGLVIETLDLFDADLPPFDRDAIEGRYGLLVGKPVPPEQAAAWARLRAIADHFLTFDGWLMSVPMWNFGLPYRLKHYIDLITHPGMTFSNDAAGQVVGLAAGRTAIVVAASAMPFGAVPAIDGLDFQLAYLKAWLGFIGVTAIYPVRVAGTFGPDDVVQAAMAEAASDADAVVVQLMACASAV